MGWPRRRWEAWLRSDLADFCFELKISMTEVISYIVN